MLPHSCALPTKLLEHLTLYTRINPIVSGYIYHVYSMPLSDVHGTRLVSSGILIHLRTVHGKNE